MISVKEYAHSRGVTIQAVHQQMSRKRNSEKLEGHVQIIEGVKYLDEYAADVLDESRKKTPVVIIDDAKDEELAALRKRVAELEQRVENKDVLIESLQQRVEHKEKELLTAKETLKQIEQKNENIDKLKSNLEEQEKTLQEYKEMKHEQNILIGQLREEKAGKEDEIRNLKGERDSWKAEADSYERTWFGFYRKKKPE